MTGTAISLSVTAAYLALSAWIEPHAHARAELHYRVVITLGYGHLIGALLGASKGRPPIPPWRALALVACGSLLGSAYLAALARASWIAAALLALSAWHTIENESMMRRAAAKHQHRIPLSRRPSSWLLSGLGAAGVASALLRPAQPSALPFGDLFAATAGYHLVSWIVFLWRGSEAGRARRALARRLLALHAGPGLIALALVALPASTPGVADLRVLFFSPQLYLYWSCLHVIHTAFVRGLEPRSARSGPSSSS